MTETKIIDLIRNPKLLNSNTVDVLRRLLLRYPYYQTLRLLLLENLYKIHSPDFNAELRKSSLLLADRSVLFRLIEGAHYEIEPQIKEEGQPQVSNQDRTLSLIENYLGDEPQNVMSRKISDSEAAQDYASYLMQLDAEENDSMTVEEEVLDFVPQKSERRQRQRIKLSEKPVEELQVPDEQNLEAEDAFTETFAYILIKQHKYEHALEIIKALNLNNPKKSSYFADQIRYLEKIILINKNKNR